MICSTDPQQSNPELHQIQSERIFRADGPSVALPSSLYNGVARFFAPWESGV